MEMLKITNHNGENIAVKKSECEMPGKPVG